MTPTQFAAHIPSNEWLVDVATDPIGKAILIADDLTMIERALLPDRPSFLTAGRRGSGKTTVLIMLLTAITGIRPPAAAWSPNEEERRGAPGLPHVGVPTIIWDNIPRGSKITCPHIERSCTTEFYPTARRRDQNSHRRRLCDPSFTGNNIGARGDHLARPDDQTGSRPPDPENRAFVHPDPIGWTQAHRGRTSKIHDPSRQPGALAEQHSGAHPFQGLVALGGSAVEHAAGLCGIELISSPLPRTGRGRRDSASSPTPW
jgi:hypothetical protein